MSTIPVTTTIDPFPLERKRDRKTILITRVERIGTCLTYERWVAEKDGGTVSEFMKRTKRGSIDPWLTFTNARAIIAPLKYAAHASMIVELSVLGIIVALIVPFRRRCRIPGTRRRCTSMTRVRGMLMTRMTRRVFTLEVIELSPTELRPGPIGVPCNWVEIRPAFNINTSQKRGNENHQRWVWWVDISFEAKDDEERNDHSTYSPKLRSFAVLLKILISKMRVSIRVCSEGLREKIKVLVRAKLSCIIF